ncbi:glycosyltransferase family 4 protein [Vibrio diabolicus]|uniref:Glycosyltransferase family 4 protein n=1 Tax=Vibrio diabolicus TaxID=50719 RepID=A0AA92R6L5_9VIBR|nr:glycosyltransferase family 4 protein [Vibrio diabolicus]QRG82642.1 glycosyltransferase family 4 protein [Vibrio diabolicus]
MHYAFIIDDYLPHSTRVGAKMFHEMAREFVRLGHDVTVITPEVNQTKQLEFDEIDGVKIWRFVSGEIKDVGKVKRAINETLLSLKAWKAIKKQISTSTFNGVVYYSPSIFFGPLVKKIKQRCSCPSYLVLRDFFPQWAIDAGMIKKGSLIEKYFRFFERLSYSQADQIGVMSEKNLKVFTKQNTQVFPIHVLRNWAALTPHDADSSSFRETHGLQNKIIFFYGGNIGHAQDMGNLMRLAKAMSHYQDAHFLFVGQGDEVELIKKLASDWELQNFTYLESVSQDEFKAILSEIDVGLFSLSQKHTAHNFPGKLLGYMVQSLPILGSVNSGNDLMPLVYENNAGLISVNGDDATLIKHAEELYQSVQYRNQLGANGYQLLCSEFSVESATKTIIHHLSQ